MAEKILIILIRNSLFWVGGFFLIPNILTLTFKDKSKGEAIDIIGVTLAIGAFAVAFLIPFLQKSEKGFSHFTGFLFFFFTSCYLTLPSFQQPISHAKSVDFIVANFSFVIILQTAMEITGVIWHERKKILNKGIGFFLGFLNLFAVLLNPDSEVFKEMKKYRNQSELSEMIVNWFSKNNFFSESQHWLIIGFLSALLLFYLSNLNEEL